MRPAISLIMITLGLTLLLGFRVLNSYRWAISEDDPTLWVKLCTTTKDKVISANSMPGTDSLSGLEPTGNEILQTVADNYNSIGSSYLRLAVYPDNPDSPSATATGDSVFTRDKASKRTITICEQDSTNPTVGGYAKQSVSGNALIGCEIKIDGDSSGDVKDLVQTITHELGHCIGLDHPMDTNNAIMSYFYDRDDNTRLLIDDKMGLVHLYPKRGVDLKEKSTMGLSCGFK